MAARVLQLRIMSGSPCICDALERRTYRKAKAAGRLKTVAILVPRVDQSEWHVEDRHDDPQFEAARGARLGEVEAVFFVEGLPGLVERERPHFRVDVEVVLGVEEHEFIAAD